MKDLSLCEECVCAPICSKLNAMGRVVSCEYFHSVPVYTVTFPSDEEVMIKATEMCGKCGCRVTHKDHVCPGCGAIFKREE